tara:strand:+ start:47 stop:1999 length:1953 start_codon:yes stop_codon:yes gene_type:complete
MTSILTNDIKDVVKKINNNPFDEINKLSIKMLENIITLSADKYYNSEKPFVTDSVYDIMLEFLQQKNPKSSVLKNIGSTIKNNKKRVPLDYWLGSMDKIKPGNKKLNSWKEKYNGPYYLSDKLDGISALLTIDNNNKMKLNTRGTSTEGLDISGLIKYLDIPKISEINKIIKKIGKGKKNKLAVRGELIMKKSTFKKNWCKRKKNVRNTISGLINSKIFTPELANDTDLVIYEIVDPVVEFPVAMKVLKNIFNTVYYKKVDTIDDSSLSTSLKDRKNNGTYDVDGIIVTNGMKHKRNTNGNPKYAFAFKDLLENMIKTTLVISIDWKISKDGKIKPTLNLNPVEFEGVTVSRVTAHNASFVCKNNIGKGTEIKITRSGDVIPYILKVTKPNKKPDMPDIKYKWNKTKVDILVDGPNDIIKLRNLQYFFSTIDAKGFGPKVIEKLFNAKYNTIEIILKMTQKDYLTIENFKEKTAYNLTRNLKEALTDILLEKLMSASNILGSGFAEKRIFAILKVYPNLMKDYKKWKKQDFIDKIMDIDGFDTITAFQFVENFKNYIKFHKKISKYIKLKKSKIIKKNIDMTVVMSGFRDKDLELQVTELGGKITSSVSKNTTYLVVVDPNSTSSKITKAKKLKVKIVSKETFINNIKNF